MNKRFRPFLGILALFFALSFYTTKEVSAKSTRLNIKVNPVLETSVNYSPITIDSDDALHESDVNFHVSSNNKTGFKTTMSTIYNSSEENATSLVYEDIDSIPTISGNVAAESFTANTWGYSLNDGTSYRPIVAKDAAVDEIFATEKASDNGDKIIKIGIKVNNDKTSGSYTNTLLFTTVPNYSPITLDDIRYMQEVTPEVCDVTPTPTTISGDDTTQYQLEDIRDGKIYFVAKLKDGNCWMVQNLDLDLSTTTTLTPEDSDVTANWTPSRATIAGAVNLNTTNWANNSNNPYSFDPGNYYFDGTYYSSATCNYLTTTCDHFATTPYDLNGEHGHVGNYYNWSAAVASNDTSATTAAGTDIDTSICPAGWRLPHGYQSARGNDFAMLNTAYGGATNSDSVLLANPLFFVRGGDVYSGSLINSAYVGYYWSSTASSATTADNLVFNSGYVDPSYVDYSRYYGFGVRCLARKQTKTLTVKDQADDSILATYDFETTYKLQEAPEKEGYNFVGYAEDPTATTPVYYAGDLIDRPKTLYLIYERPLFDMQDIATWKNYLNLEEQVQAKDVRDNKIYWVAKLKDGNVWMTQNLDYDLSITSNRTLKPETSNVTTTRTITLTEWALDANNMHYYDNGDYYFPNGSGTLASTNCSQPKNEKCHYAYGDYYSWRTATASVGSTSVLNTTVNESICPKGWRLPIGNSYTANYSFGKLTNAYGVTNSAQGNGDAVLLKAPVYFTRGGNNHNGTVGNYIGNAFYWSATTGDDPGKAYHYASTAKMVSAESINVRHNGFSIRCVAL